MNKLANDRKPAFLIDTIPVYGQMILAPMDGLSDLPTRQFFRKYGSAVSYTEFLNAIDVLNWNRNIESRFAYTEAERPVGFQLLDNDPVRILEAAKRLLPFHPDFFDINIGCPARVVTSRGAGASLLRQPETIRKIITDFKNTFQIPITAKIRLGWDDTCLNYLEIAKLIEDSGGSLVAVHGRTRAQGYSGTARWEPIAEVKAALKIPVLANGDIRSVHDIDQILAVTGCDGVMIGRAALGNPWIFSKIEKHTVSLRDRIPAICTHLDGMMSFYGADFGILLFRKHLKAYLRDIPIPREDLVGLVTSSSADQIRSDLERISSLLPALVNDHD